MERWEPPVNPEPAEVKKHRAPLVFSSGQDAVPETVEIIIPRLIIGFMLLLPASGRVPSIWLSGVGPLMVLVLLGFSTLQSTWGSSLSRAAWLMDGLALGLMTPVLVINAFAATGNGPLHHAETSVYLQTIVAATVVLIGLVLYGSRLQNRQALSWGILFLPAALTAVGLLSDYADFKTTTIVLALAIVWLFADVVTAISQMVSGGFAVILPAISYGAYVFVVALKTGSGLSFGGRPAPVSFVHPIFILVLGVSLLAPLVPSVNRLVDDVAAPSKRIRGAPRRRRRNSNPQRGSRSTNDSVDHDDLEDFRT